MSTIIEETQEGPSQRVEITRPEVERVRDAISLLRGPEPVEIAPEIAQSARRIVRRHNLVHALVDSGILTDRSFLDELRTRVAQRLLPRMLAADDIRHLFVDLFSEGRQSWKWLADIDPARLAEALTPLIRREDFDGIPHPDIETAMHVLSHRIGALGLDDEFHQRLHFVQESASPFLNLTVSTRQFLDNHRVGRGDLESYRQLLNLVGDCRALVQHVRAQKARYGTSLRLTRVSRRLLQQLERFELLVHLVHPQNATDYARSLAPVLLELIEAEFSQTQIGKLIRESTDLLAFQVTEQTARKGQKYVTETAAGYWTFLKKASLGGAIVGVFAMFKLLLSALALPLGIEAILYSLNYSLCFVLIYVSGAILATKQPAMTASTIARRIDEAQTREEALSSVRDLVVLVWRSQFISFVGNLLLAFPIAALMTFLVHQIGFTVTEDKATKLVASAHPFASGALFFAAIAGVYLFGSGVIAGWVDTHTRYNRIDERVANLRSLPPALRKRAAKFLADHLGMITGNVALGTLLGTAGTIGILLGIPFDIRHIAFSSANLGVASFAMPELIGTSALYWGLVGVLGIGFVNFVVSFGLTIVTTLSSRSTSFGQWRQFVWGLLGEFIRNPLRWFYPVKQSPETAGVESKP